MSDGYGTPQRHQWSSPTTSASSPSTASPGYPQYQQQQQLPRQPQQQQQQQQPGDRYWQARASPQYPVAFAPSTQTRHTTSPSPAPTPAPYTQFYQYQPQEASSQAKPADKDNSQAARGSNYPITAPFQVPRFLHPWPTPGAAGRANASPLPAEAQAASYDEWLRAQSQSEKRKGGR